MPADHPDPHAQDAGLVRKARAGDREAFTRLYERHAPLARGVLLARVPWREVDDLLQEVFLTAWKRLARLRDPKAFSGWIVTIARNRATDHHRRRRPAEELVEDPAGPAPPLAEALSALRVLQELPLAYRETLTLRLVEGMTGPEIARACGLTPGSVRVNLHRGMKLLRERLSCESAGRNDDD